MQRKHKNNLGIAGWLFGGRYSADRYVYALHRVTGLGILFYFLMHIFVTGSRLGGPEKWEGWMDFFSQSPFFLIGEFLVFLAFLFHAINGVRLIFVELGIIIGKPGLPTYPYSYSTLRQRRVMLCTMGLVAILACIAGADFVYLMMPR
ncbi:MAG: succinate dehydrogenase [Acidobacteriota bacterium]|jgi:succinate dehydrogenase / fumarate reductase cytochrome b subunit|nr:succinate dehydrogenase [Acidobacteriota bacterium]